MLNEVLQALEQQKSYSRAGRLMEGRNAARGVALFNQKPQPSSLDMSKVLSVTEVNGADTSNEADVVCSSARDHPSVALKTAYIAVSEKRNLFDESLHSYVKHQSPPDQYNESSKSKMLNESPETIDMPNEDKGSSSFLAVPREQTSKRPLPQNPPVGHYNPRYTAVEPLMYNCILPKQLRRRAHTPDQLTASPIPVAGRAHTSMEEPSSGQQGTPSPMSIPHNSSKPTWPFKSRTVAHYSKVVPLPANPNQSASTYNEALLTKKQPVLCNMERSMGRTEEKKAISVDLMYNPTLSPIRVANLRMSRTTGREPSHTRVRNASEVPRCQSRLDVDNYATFKYRKQTVIADFDKYPSKDIWINSSIPIRLNQTTNRSEIPTEIGTSMLQSMDRLRDVSFKQMLPRKEPKRSDGFGLEYDTDLAFNEKHMPSTNLQKAPRRELGATPIEASDTTYVTEVDKYKRKLARSIQFDSYPTRAERELTGRTSKVVLHETQAELDPAFDALALPPTLRPTLKGDPRMSSHISRSRRERALSPPTDSHDLMYTYNVDDYRSPLRKGAVAFERMVSREKHGGSAFANSMNAMMRK